MWAWAQSQGARAWAWCCPAICGTVGTCMKIFELQPPHLQNKSQSAKQKDDDTRSKWVKYRNWYYVIIKYHKSRRFTNFKVQILILCGDVRSVSWKLLHDFRTGLLIKGKARDSTITFVQLGASECRLLLQSWWLSPFQKTPTSLHILTLYVSDICSRGR